MKPTDDIGAEILTGQAAKDHFDPDEARVENEAAYKRLRTYIEEHKGNMLALDVFTALFNQYGED